MIPLSLFLFAFAFVFPISATVAFLLLVTSSLINSFWGTITYFFFTFALLVREIRPNQA